MGVQVDDPLHVGLDQIMNDHTREIQKKYKKVASIVSFGIRKPKICPSTLHSVAGTQCSFAGAYI